MRDKKEETTFKFFENVLDKDTTLHYPSIY